VKEKTISAVMREMGRKGGKRRMQTMTKAERKALSKKAAVESARVRAARGRILDQKPAPTQKKAEPDRTTK
jgi:hypothetical protein